MRPKLTYSNVVSTLCLVLLLGGGAAYAASHLGRNTVGARQLKKNAVTTAKIKREAVTAAKVKQGTLTGRQINAATLGTVPTARTANTLSAPEPWHEVGLPGEPAFEGTWHNHGESSESVAFYKDSEGVVHLRGEAKGSGASLVFRLPPGFRPAAHKELNFKVYCFGPGECTAHTGTATIVGPNGGADDSGVFAPASSEGAGFDGITFRAES